ncbi:lipoprotein [Salinisphaera sp. T5B8]|uniref:DUF302 domain-containing protein n=1 Tax=unclassified Salinisphaera TaxID=2649847 RepID=UPI00333ED2A5
MRARQAGIGITLFFVLAVLATATAGPRGHYDRAAPADKAFVDVVLDLEQAIGQHNFAITARNEIGQAIRQRGHADFGDATIVHFCNLEYARRVIAIDPDLILYMPCRIAVFDKGTRVHVASWLLPTDTHEAQFNALAGEINTHIRAIVDAAVVPIVAPANPPQD